MAPLPSPTPLLTGPILTAVNHLLRGQPWLRQRLQAFSGRVAVLKVFPVELLVAVTAEGELKAAESAAAPDVVVRIPATAALGLLRGDEHARAQVALDGDPAFAAVLAGVLRELRWDVEEDLSRVVGDIAAHRIVQTGQSFLAWQQRTASDLAHTRGEYLTEERPVLAQRHELERWVREVDDVRDAVERLEKRIVRLRSSSRG